MLASEFKGWRKKLRLTQEEAANRFNVSRITIQNWEAGTTPVPKLVDEAVAGDMKQASEYGPVMLYYGNVPAVRPKNGFQGVAEMQMEGFANNATALKRVQELWGRPDFSNPFIRDAEGIVWNFPQLRREMERRLRSKQPGLAERLMEIGRHCASLPVLDNRTDDEILGYDEFGIPR
ncbi:MAG TPA: helix-turn-helix domain-containing protein [Stellaceae bacterium]|jgi:transcriptional regulator with XRE-family HTH domain|nr:helix-turn-helix domain-containing protein [Stellaceae bacterium]